MNFLYGSSISHFFTNEKIIVIIDPSATYAFGMCIKSLGKSWPITLTLQISSNKILPHILEKLKTLLTKLQLQKVNTAEIQCTGKLDVIYTVFRLHY